MPRKGLLNYKWEPAQPIRRADHLISAPQMRHLKPFTPSYEQDKHINMNYIMSWEYGRMWFEECKKWSLIHFGTTRSNELIQRKYVMRGPKKPAKKI